MLPIKDHALMLSDQYLLRCHLPGHPGNKHLDRPPPPRNMKHDLNSRLPGLATLVNPPKGIISYAEYKAGVKELHTTCVRTATASYTHNKVLQAPAPAIDKSETELPRKTRALLAQLRSSYCSQLKSYSHRINNLVSDVCPDCGETPHDVHHLFACTSHPTDLAPLDLWEHPKEVATFLATFLDT